MRVNRLDVEKGKKRTTDLVIEKSVELYGFTPNEKSDENLKWMRENGYLVKHARRYKHGIRGRRSKSRAPPSNRSRAISNYIVSLHKYS